MSLDRIAVHGTELLAEDPREVYRQKLARITLDSMVQFVGLLDAQGTVLEINKVALDAVGIKLSEVEGKPFWTTFWWQVSPEINDLLRECIRRAAAGEFVRWDTPIYGRAGGKETIVIDASLMPVRDDRGNVVFIAAEGRDITEKKAYEREIARQREELAQLDRLKTEFFANISHEFRTPLTLMLGPLEDALASRDGLSQANRERLELAHRNALRQFKLVNALLDFSRIEAGRIQASYEATDLAALTSELASVWRSAVERAGLSLIFHSETLSEPAFVDREMWEKVVLNLISNAFKFTFAGEIAIALKQAGDRAVLTVRDTGTGIPAEELPRLFERFHRVKGAQSRSFEGSGIGLALVQELVRLHGGTVHAESELGRGSRFTVAIPLGKQHLPADRIEAPRDLVSTASRTEAYVEEALRWLPNAPRARETPDRAGARLLRFGREQDDTAARTAPRSVVLLADDNADMRDYVARLLAQAGHAVQTAEDGAAALKAARNRKPDLILTDVMMPGLDGFGVLREVRADAGLRDVPVILLSARAGEESRIEGVEAGADDYLVKPFSARELLARVDAQLSLAQLRRETTAALSDSELRFRALVSASSDVVYSMSPDWSEMRHLDGREFIADTLEPSQTWIDKYIDPADQPLVLEKINAAIAGRSVFELEHRVRRLDGSFGWTHSRAVPLFDDDELVEWIGMASDITERKHLEESLRRADRRKDEFLATLAHELRNPLAPIRNAIHLLKAADVADIKVRAAREIVDRQVQHMVRLVDDLLDVSRITLGQITLRREAVSLRSVIADALEASGPVIEAGTHALSVELPADVLKVDGDPIRLSQLFQNIINNAARYTPVGGQITIRPERIGNEARVSIRDTGIGIAKEFQSRVFDLFARVHPEDRTTASGLGIGLALAKQIVELHGGRLELYSEGPGAGSEFVVCLPVKPEGSAAEPLTPAPAARVRRNGRRVLVVDDNRDAAESLAMLLRIDGHTVRVAVNGAGALRELEEFTPDVSLLDIGLPDMSGYELARRARATPHGAGTVLIALTGWGQAEDKRRAAEAGFDEHFTKPVDPAMLSALLLGEDQRSSATSVARE